MNRRTTLAGVALLLSLCAGVAYATSTSLHYVPDATATAYRSNLDGGDVTDLSSTGTTAIADILVTGQQSITIGGRLSTASATCVVTVCRYAEVEGTMTLQGVSTGTLTASATQTDGTDAVAPDLFFDTAGCKTIRVLAADPSAGTIDLWTRLH